MEYQILKLLLNREFYEQTKGILSSKLFSTDIGSIYNTITYIYNKYTCNSITIEELYNVHLDVNQLTTAKKELLDIVFTKLRATETPNEEIVRDLIQSMYRRNMYIEITELCARGINEGTDVAERLREVLSFVETGPEVKASDYPSDLDTFLSASAPEVVWPLYPQSTTDRIPGVVRGNLIVVFGRPEVGKSSYVGALCGNFLRQGLNVHYFGNEEPIHKIGLNIVRNIVNKSDRELQAERGKQYPEWEEARQKLKLFDAVGYSVHEIDAHAKNESPDVIILDQADKLRIDGTYSADHSKLKDLYVATREIAKRRDCVVVNVSQAGYDAQDKREVTYDMLDGSKTGKAGEADIIIGIGKDPGIDEQLTRYLTISKNKISGWHGLIPVTFNPWTNQWS